MLDIYIRHLSISIFNSYFVIVWKLFCFIGVSTWQIWNPHVTLEQTEADFDMFYAKKKIASNCNLCNCLLAINVLFPQYAHYKIIPIMVYISASNNPAHLLVGLNNKPPYFKLIHFFLMIVRILDH